MKLAIGESFHCLRLQRTEKSQFIPILGNNFTFKQRECGLKSLRKEGASIEKYNPFFLSDFRCFDALKYEIISWDWYNIKTAKKIF
jgi:hypothetical protein